MTIWDFLSQAGFWQWVGILFLGGVAVGIANGLGHLRLWGDVTHNHYQKKDEK